MSLPLVGRLRELDEARRLIAAGRGVLFTGPPGIGKTRLLQALDEADDLPLERITGTDATASIALGALVRFLPDELTSPPGVDALGAVRTSLLQVGDRGAVVGVDDVDRIDPVSAAVLADVARAGVPLVLTSRSLERVPPSLLDLLDEAVIAPLPIAPLSEHDAVALVRAVARKGTPRRSLSWAVELGEGNPLLLTELARVAPRADFEEFPLSERLRRVVGERLTSVSPPARRILELLAYDAPLPLALLGAVENDAAVDELERSDLVAVEPGPAHLVTVTHPLITEVVHEELTEVRRSALGKALVQVVGERLATVPDGTVRHARWQVDAGEVTAPQIVRDASRELLIRWDPKAAAELGTTVLRHLPHDPAPALVLAGAAVVGERYDEAEERYAMLAERSDLSPPQRLQTMMGRAEAAYFGRGDETQARAVLETAVADVPEAAEPVAALSAVIALCAGRYPEAEAAAARVTQRAPADLRLMAAAAAHVAIGSAGRLHEAWNITEEALPLLDDRAVSPEHHFRFAAGRQYLRLQLGEIDEMRREARASSAAERLRAVASDSGLAYGELIAGRGDHASEHLDHARARLERTDPYGHRTFIGYIGAELAALQGRRRDALRAARAAADAHRQHLGWWRWAVPAAAGWAAAADHQPESARDELRKAAAMAAGNGDLVHRCCCLLAALRLGAIDVAEELADASAGIDGRLWPAVAIAARGVVEPADPEGGLERGCAQLLDVGANLWAVSLLARGAHIDRAAGRAERAARRQSAAERHAQKLVRVSPPALRLLREGPHAALPPRQRQIATLAAEGLTNRQIASRLMLSVRTIENQLARSYETLGVTTRRHLAEVLRLRVGAEGDRRLSEITEDPAATDLFDR